MGINHCDGHDRFTSDSCSLTPLGGERSRRGTNRLGFGQLLEKTRHDIARVSDPWLILRFVRCEPKAPIFLAGQLPDQPIAGFNEAIGSAPKTRVLLGQ